jgi:hypothetical protein
MEGKLKSAAYVGLALAAAGLFSSGASAAPVVYEGFNYDLADGATITATTAITGTGYTGNYIPVGTSSAETITYATTGLSFSTFPTSGGALVASALGDGMSLAGTLASTSTITGDLYASYLVQFSSFSTSTNPTFSEVRVADTSGAFGGTARFRTQAEGSANGVTPPGIGYDSGATASGGSALSTGQTYLVIARYTNVGAALDSTTQGTSTLYVLNTDQYDDLNANGGVTQANLDAVGRTVGTGATNIVARVSDAAVTTGTFSFNGGNFTQISVAPGNTPGQTEALKIDEIHFGATLADVLVVPEPASLASIAFAAVPAFLRRRRIGDRA